jgi:hypothetical protein
LRRADWDAGFLAADAGFFAAGFFLLPDADCRGLDAGSFSSRYASPAARNSRFRILIMLIAAGVSFHDDILLYYSIFPVKFQWEKNENQNEKLGMRNFGAAAPRFEILFFILFFMHFLPAPSSFLHTISKSSAKQIPQLLSPNSFLCCSA